MKKIKQNKMPTIRLGFRHKFSINVRQKRQTPTDRDRHPWAGTDRERQAHRQTNRHTYKRERKRVGSIN